MILFDLPGVEQSLIEMPMENNVLSVSAERQWQPTDQQTVVVAERPQGRFGR